VLCVVRRHQYSIYQWCEQDQILKTKTTTTRPRPRPKLTRPRPRSRPEWQDQDQDQSLQDQDPDQDQSDKTKTKTGLSHHGCSYCRTMHVLCPSSKQFPFSVFKRLLYLTYSKFDSTVLTIRTACIFIDNKYTTHFATHKNAQSQLVTVQCSLSANQNVKDLARNIKYSHSHKILVALQHHKFTQYSVNRGWGWANGPCNGFGALEIDGSTTTTTSSSSTSNNVVHSRRFLIFLH